MGPPELARCASYESRKVARRLGLPTFKIAPHYSIEGTSQLSVEIFFCLETVIKYLFLEQNRVISTNSIFIF